MGAPCRILVVVAALLLTPVGTVAAADSTLTPEGDVKVELGLDRGVENLVLHFTSPTKVEAAPTAELSNVLDGARPFDGDVTIGTVTLVQEGRTVRVPVTVTPKSSATEGNYTTTVSVRGTGIADAASKLTLSIDEPPGWWWLVAAGLLFLGAFVGLAFKWVTDNVGKLRDLWDRYFRLEAVTRGSKPHPAQFERAINDVEALLADNNITGAEAAMTKAEALKDDVQELSEMSRALELAVASQRAQLDEMTVDEPARSDLVTVITVVEPGWIAKALRENDITSAEARKQRQTNLDHADLFSRFLREYARRPSDLAAALGLFVDDRFDDAKAAWDKARPAAAADVMPAAVGGDADASETMVAGALSALRQRRAAGGGPSWPVRHSVGVLTFVAAAVLTLLGLLTIWDPSTMFRANTAKDVVVLLAWGVGSGLAGVGFADLAGKLTAKPTSGGR